MAVLNQNSGSIGLDGTTIAHVNMCGIVAAAVKRLVPHVCSDCAEVRPAKALLWHNIVEP
jgi:hypothetical protein